MSYTLFIKKVLNYLWKNDSESGLASANSLVDIPAATGAGLGPELGAPDVTQVQEHYDLSHYSFLPRCALAASKKLGLGAQVRQYKM